MSGIPYTAPRHRAFMWPAVCGDRGEPGASRLRLRRLTDADLPSVRQWFEDDCTRRFLGGPHWPDLVLRRSEAPPDEFRGRQVLRKHVWVGIETDRAVGLVTVECYTDRSAELSVVVDPVLRRRGLCQRIVLAALELVEMKDIDEVRAAVQPENSASLRCLERVGFTVLSAMPDDENNVTLIYHRV